MGANEGNGAGLMKPPSIAAATPITSSAPSPAAANDGRPVEGEGSQGDDAAAVRKALAANTWGAAGPAGATVAHQLAARVEARRDGRERPVATPWESVNAALGGGVWPGFHVLVGGTGAGKSQWALQLAVHAAKAEGIPALYLALELDAFGLFCRAASLVSWGRVRDEHGAPAAPRWSELYTGKATLPGFVAAELGALPFHWCEAKPHGFPYGDIAPAVEALRAQYPKHAGPVVVVVDFLQLVSSPDGAREDLRERIGRAAYACRAIAREHNAVVIALSSTARRPPGDTTLTVKVNDEGEYVRTVLHDLVGLGKESGDVEYSADSVMVLCRESWPEGEPPPKGGRRVHLGVAKLRAGEGSWCVLAFQGGTRFVDATDAPADTATSSAPPAKARGKGKRKGAKSSAPPPDNDPRTPDDSGEGD